ncbi:hypothetical protein FACS189450_14260 [Spirochaetia bacterium]|nr:hypothetical protein FACS189450_14260 [Spirochaetia bacterium]
MTNENNAEVKAALERIETLLVALVKNTNPPGKLQRIADILVYVVSIAGAVAIVDQIIRWLEG